MRQLTSLDAQFLAIEDSRHTGHVAGLAILDPSTAPGGRLGCGEIKDLLRERLPLLPPMRWRVAEVPFNLDYPYWVEDDEFDLDYHVRELALASPGSERQLAQQVSRIVSRPLDRARPLWELYLIEGLESGHVAMLTKIHHAVIDGMSGQEILGMLLDLSPEGRPAPARANGNGDVRGHVGNKPGEPEMLVRAALGVPRYPLRLLRSIPSALPNATDAPAVFGSIPGATTVGRVAARVQRALGVDIAPPAPGLRAPKVEFSKRISPHRRFAFGQLPLDEVKTVKNRFGVTVNDVVVTLCAGAVRQWLVAHDDLPECPLVTQVPVSVRGEDQQGTFGNRILLMSAPLFTDEPDPVQRLLRTHEALRGMKERHKALPAELLQDANNFIPPAVFARASQLVFRVSTGFAGRPNWNLVISNVPGPRVPLYCAGAELQAHYPVSVITDGMGLNITVMSYLDHLDFGIVADREQMPDLWTMIDGLRASLDELLAA